MDPTPLTAEELAKHRAWIETHPQDGIGNGLALQMFATLDDERKRYGRLDVDRLAEALRSDRVRRYVMEAWVDAGVSESGYATPEEMATAIAREYAALSPEEATLEQKRRFLASTSMSRDLIDAALSPEEEGS